jgi:pimeloyl-ACP methyl ester carboxylesterase
MDRTLSRSLHKLTARLDRAADHLLRAEAGISYARGHDYLPFARAPAQSFAVHVIDRRGRGHSGPQGAEYRIERELEDLFAVQAHTGATAVFGHSYGGLVALEAATRSAGFTDVVVYEPGVSVAGSIPLGWLPRGSCSPSATGVGRSRRWSAGRAARHPRWSGCHSGT